MSIGAIVLSAAVLSFGQSREAIALQGVSNQGGFLASLDEQRTDGSTAFASINRSFTGMDGTGNQQTMIWTGETMANAEFGRLRVSTQGSLINSYNNPANAPFADPNGQIINEEGSPDSLASLGFAIFTDVLHFGGTLQAGYRARYIFHVDGTNSGTGFLADLAFDVDGQPGNSFFAFDPGFTSQTWVTDTFDVNGITPQTIRAQFSTQVVFDTFNLTDGEDYSGLSDFSSTLILEGIEMLDADGNSVSGWTVTSDSGTVYNTVPEPATITAFAALGLPALLRRRRARK